MRSMVKAATILGVLACCVVHADPTLMLIPSPDIAGAPGETIGWGYSITNDTTFYLLVDSSNFCGVGGDPAFTDCTTPYDPPFEFGPSYGTYQDYIASNLTIIAPLSTASESFDSTLMTGVGAYMIDPAAPMGAIDIGNVFVSYQEFNGDPLSGGTQASGDIEMSSPASVMVVPEPVTLALTGWGLLALGWARRRSRK